MTKTRLARMLSVALLAASGCAGAAPPADPPAESSDEACPVRKVRTAAHRELEDGLLSLLRTVSTYETVAVLMGRSDLQACAARARHDFELVLAQLRGGLPLDEDAIWDGVAQLQAFERLLYHRETLRVSAPVTAGP